MDTFLTIKQPAEGYYTEKRSKFLAFAFPVTSIQNVKEIVEEYQKKYYDARHLCYAYMIGPERTNFRANDNGEPSGTAGKPILGQINSKNLTDILIIVVRYFGGVKLGTGGLIVAYRLAAADAIANATIFEKKVMAAAEFNFDYIDMNDVMKVVKDMKPDIIEQKFDNNCYMILQIRKDDYQQLIDKLNNVKSLKFIEETN